MKMAQTSAEFTEKQYEQKKLDNKQLRDLTLGAIKRLRTLENQYQTASRQTSDAHWNTQIAKSSEMKNSGKSAEEMRQQAIAEAQQYQVAETQLRNQL